MEAVKEMDAGSFRGDAGREAKAGVVQITFFTNPLCCWSWAFEPQWRRLRYEYGEQITWRYCMTELPPDQEIALACGDGDQVMRRLWSRARHVSGMPFNPDLWIMDPPDSTLPARLACKAVELQSADAADRYLRLLRQAAALEYRNIARRDVLIDLGEMLARETGSAFDPGRFRRDLDAADALAALQADRHEANARGFPRSPGLLLQRPDRRFSLMAAPCAYGTLQEHVRLLAPDLRPLRHALDAEGYASYWGRITGREIAEALPSEPGPVSFPIRTHARHLSAEGPAARQGVRPESHLWLQHPSRSSLAHPAAGRRRT